VQDEPSRKKPTLQMHACSAKFDFFDVLAEFSGQLIQDEPSRKEPTLQVHWLDEVEPVLSVVPLPQLAQDEPSRKKPTLQMH